MSIVIETARLILREIDLTSDDLSIYLGWLRDIENNRFIESAKVDYEMDELKFFISSANLEPGVLLFGIFLKEGKNFIGTLKIQPINHIEKYVWLGMMIGSPEFRGRGYGRESLETTVNFLFNSLEINDIFLGVNLENLGAIYLYESVGFEKFKVEKNRMVMKKSRFT
jgi:RimJ/RimL family protein N-acetyltransferase